MHRRPWKPPRRLRSSARRNASASLRWNQGLSIGFSRPAARAGPGRAADRVRLLGMEPGAVDGFLEARGGGDHHDPRPRLRELGLIEARREAHVVGEIARAEGDPLYPPRPLVDPQVLRL